VFTYLVTAFINADSVPWAGHDHAYAVSAQAVIQAARPLDHDAAASEESQATACTISATQYVDTG